MTSISHDSETLAEGQQVITVCAFIHQQIDGVEKVFMPRRAITKKFLPGVFELPGGHVNFGEDLTAALEREIDEELGMQLQVGDCFQVFTYTNDIKRSQTIEVVYFASFVGDSHAIELHPEDHSEYGWFAELELEQATTPAKGLDDDEFIAIKKGFALLRGEPLRS